jgi:hypothetical protein
VGHELGNEGLFHDALCIFALAKFIERLLDDSRCGVSKLSWQADLPLVAKDISLPIPKFFVLAASISINLSSSSFRCESDFGDIELSKGIEDGDHGLVVGVIGAVDDDLEFGVVGFEGLQPGL